MTYRVRALDLGDDAELTLAHDLVTDAWMVDRPYAATPSLHERLLAWRHIDPAERHDLVGAFDGESLVGVQSVHYPLNDNTHMVWVESFVAPQNRRRGIGSALMEYALASAKAQGRTDINAEVACGTHDPQRHPHYLFMLKHHFTQAYTEVLRRVPLPIDNAVLDRHAHAAEQRYADRYELETHVDGAPQHRLASLCEAMNRLGVDAPTGAIEFEEETFDPARYQEYIDLERAQGRRRITTLALERGTDVVAAYTDLMLPAGSPVHVWQWGTLVRGDHRGSRLGMAVKVANIRYLQQHFPEREHITTGNNGTNEFMVSINEDLGFRILELCPAFTRKL